ncbi:uncharacterized protein TNCV_2584271 [Trichonephila clavipes]|nr:uncharacterized protein TNCV_2584271 [Trichonephila clavipes]
MSAIADFKRNGGRKTFGTGLPAPSEEPPRLNFAQNERFGLAIHQNDHQSRRRFVEWAQNEIAVVPDFHQRILFSDEAHFWLNGYVNKQNCRIWSEANPQVYVETPLHPEKLTVWCALWAGGIIGPYFKNDEGHNVTVNGDCAGFPKEGELAKFWDLKERVSKYMEENNELPSEYLLLQNKDFQWDFVISLNLGLRGALFASSDATEDPSCRDTDKGAFLDKIEEILKSILKNVKSTYLTLAFRHDVFMDTTLAMDARNCFENSHSPTCEQKVFSCMQLIPTGEDEDHYERSRECNLSCDSGVGQEIALSHHSPQRLIFFINVTPQRDVVDELLSIQSPPNNKRAAVAQWLRYPTMAGMS